LNIENLLDFLVIAFLTFVYRALSFTSGWIYIFGDTHPHGLVIFYKPSKFEEIGPAIA
jgi:hypothetical protein